MPKKKSKGKDVGFPHEMLEALVFGEPFEELSENMQSPLRALTKQISAVAGDSLYAVMQSKGDPKQALAGQARVAIDNLEVGPQIAKTALMGGMESTIRKIMKNVPEPKE